MKTMFAKHPHYLKFLPSFLKGNKQFLKPILAENGAILQYASSKVQADSGYIISFLQHDMEMFQEERKDVKENRVHSTQQEIKVNAFDQKKNYHKLILYSSDSVKNNLNSVIKIMTYAQDKSDYRFYKYLPTKYKESALFWLEFVKATNSLKLLSYGIKNNVHLNAMIQKELNGLSVSDVIELLSHHAEKEVFDKKSFV